MSNSIDTEIVGLYCNGRFSMKQIADLKQCSVNRIRYVLDKHNVARRGRSEALRFLNLTKYKKGGFTIKENLSVEEEKLKVAGIMLYWGEGTKSGGSVTFSNSDPEMIKTFLSFLRIICGISENRLHPLIHVYEDHNEESLKKFWSEVMGIPKEQFYKSHLHKKKIGTYKKISKYGTLSLRYSDKELQRIILMWIESYSKYAINRFV